MIKLLITALLMMGIYATHLMVGKMINEEIQMNENKFKFAELGQEIAQLKRLADYQEIAARPLFDNDREPYREVVVKPEVKEKKVEKPLRIQALGIAVTDEDLMAVVKDLRTGKISRLRVNDTIDGWTLNSVATDEFSFSKGERRQAVKYKTNEN